MKSMVLRFGADINSAIEKYRNAHKNRFPTQSKPNKPDVALLMLENGRQWVIDQASKMEKEVKEFAAG